MTTNVSLTFPKPRFPFPSDYQPKPGTAGIYEVPVSLGSFAELLWRHTHRLHTNPTCEGRADLAAWVARRPELARNLDLANPVHVRMAERERIDFILDKVRDGRGWPAGGSILMSGSGWPIGFESRPGLGKVARAEVSWFSEVAGLDLLWRAEPDGWVAVVGLPRSGIPEIENAAAIIREAGC